MGRIHAPLTSFGVELQQTLREGANRHIKITFPNEKLAIRFKQRIHALRAAMKNAKHGDWEQLYRCGITEDPANPCIVHIGPKDSEFRSILADAGIAVDTPPPTLTEVTISDTKPGDVDSFLSDLTSVTSVQETLAEDTDGPSIDNL